MTQRNKTYQALIQIQYSVTEYLIVGFGDVV